MKTYTNELEAFLAYMEAEGYDKLEHNKFEDLLEDFDYRKRYKTVEGVYYE